MKVKITTKRDKLDKFEAAFETLKGKTVNVGYPDNSEAEYIGLIHEYGCKIPVTDKMRKYLAARGLPLNPNTRYITIPERSYLRAGFDASMDEISNLMNALIDDLVNGRISAKAVAKGVGVELSSAIKEYAINLNTPPNHPFTIEQKDSSNPLVDTGDMIGAISYEVVDE